MSDIRLSELKRALRESTRKLDTLVNNLPGFVYRCRNEPEWTMEYLSDGVAEVTGYPASDFIENAKRSYNSIIQAEDRARVWDEVQQALGGRQPYVVEYRISTARGDQRWVWEKGSGVFDGETLIALEGFVTNVTDRKCAEQALRDSEEQYRQLFELESDALFLIDNGSKRILEVNLAAERLYGYSRAELLVLRNVDLSAEPDATVRATHDGLNRVPVRYHRKKDGTVFPVEITATHFDWRGMRVHLAAIRDITERQRAEQERDLLQAQLAQAQKMEMIGRLAGGVAHDFNNLLTVINGYSELLLDRLGAQDPLRDSVQQVRNAGERAAALTRQLLAFSRKEIIDPRPLNLNEMITELGKMLRRLLGEDIELVTVLDPNLGVVTADAGQMQQVVMNLAVNARDAMPDGGKLVIETADVELDAAFAGRNAGIAPGEYVTLTVSDTGAGMTPEVQQQIFEPFFTTKAKGAGTGLGLSTAYGVVRQSGGTISVYSQPGGGATFRVYLPRTGARGESEKDLRTAAVSLRGKETVLVVEDQPEVRKLAVEVLRGYGYRVLEASGGAEAIEACRLSAGPVHLLLTDVIMPGMDGRGLVERFAALYPGVKVLYMSGYSGELIAHRGILDPGVAYLAKPFTPQGLAAKVREVLGAAGQPRLLVADDEPAVRRFLCRILRAAGYEVAEAADGKEALRMVSAGGFDAVITDLVMPEQEGIETIRILRQSYPDLKIVAISGAFGGQFLKVVRRLGADAALPKPIEPKHLLDAVRSVLAV
jgi:PAS domain S-box-containing protein